MRRLLVFTFLVVGTTVFAQSGSGKGTPPQPGRPAPVPAADAGSGSGSGSGSDGQIAPPAPEASPEQVKKAKETSKAAELTPIVPSPGNPTRPAFQLYAEIDVPILATGLVFALGRQAKTQPAFCAPLCTSHAHINRLDELTLGYYSSSWALTSNVALYGLAAGSVGLLLADEGALNMINDIVVIGQATLSATAVASIMTLAAGRPRPLLYGETAPLSIRNSGDAGLSFISSHTAMSFSIATSLFIAEHRLHPRSNMPYVVLGGGLAVASFVAVTRVEAGYHFITDAIAGAVVGSSIGVIVASVHKSPVHVVPVVNHDPTGNVSGAGMGVSGSF